LPHQVGRFQGVFRVPSATNPEQLMEINLRFRPTNRVKGIAGINERPRIRLS
jgi:hypothetical protein